MIEAQSKTTIPWHSLFDFCLDVCIQHPFCACVCSRLSLFFFFNTDALSLWLSCTKHYFGRKCRRLDQWCHSKLVGCKYTCYRCHFCHTSDLASMKGDPEEGSLCFKIFLCTLDLKKSSSSSSLPILIMSPVTAECNFFAFLRRVRKSQQNRNHNKANLWKKIFCICLYLDQYLASLSYWKCKKLLFSIRDFD